MYNQVGRRLCALPHGTRPHPGRTLYGAEPPKGLPEIEDLGSIQSEAAAAYMHCRMHELARVQLPTVLQAAPYPLWEFQEVSAAAEASQPVTGLTRHMSACRIHAGMQTQNASWHGSALPPHMADTAASS